MFGKCVVTIAVVYLAVVCSLVHATNHSVWTTNTATSKGTSATATTAKFNTGDLSSITITPTGNQTDDPHQSTVTPVTPGNYTTPGGNTTDHPSTVTSSVEPSTTEKSSFDGASFGGGIAAGIAIAIFLLCLIYLFYYCRKPNPSYEEC